MPCPPLTIVAAIARNGAIGRNNALPWTVPTDLARFRALTMGRPMIMGRRTFEAIGRNLPGRESIVVSHRPPSEIRDGVHYATNLEAALMLAGRRAEAMEAPEIALVGGAVLFTAMMGQATRLALTIIDCEPTADTFFPRIDPWLWRETVRTVPPRHPRDDAACVFVEYERAGG